MGDARVGRGLDAALVQSERPSLKPINRRWDRSRGIIFGVPKRPIPHETWRAGTAIVFRDCRGYTFGSPRRPVTESSVATSVPPAPEVQRATLFNAHKAQPISLQNPTSGSRTPPAKITPGSKVSSADTSSLDKKVTQLARTTSQLAKQRDELIKDVARLTEANAELARQRDNSVQDVARSAKHRDKLTQNLAQSTQKTAQLIQDRDKLIEDVDRLTQNNAKLVRENARSNQEYAQLSGENARLRNLPDEARSEVRYGTSEDYRASIGELEKKLASMEGKARADEDLQRIRQMEYDSDLSATREEYRRLLADRDEALMKARKEFAHMQTQYKTVLTTTVEPMQTRALVRQDYEGYRQLFREFRNAARSIFLLLEHSDEKMHEREDLLTEVQRDWTRFLESSQLDSKHGDMILKISEHHIHQRSSAAEARERMQQLKASLESLGLKLDRDSHFSRRLMLVLRRRDRLFHDSFAPALEGMNYDRLRNSLLPEEMRTKLFEYPTFLSTFIEIDNLKALLGESFERKVAYKMSVALSGHVGTVFRPWFQHLSQIRSVLNRQLRGAEVIIADKRYFRDAIADISARLEIYEATCTKVALLEKASGKDHTEAEKECDRELHARINKLESELKGKVGNSGFGHSANASTRSTGGRSTYRSRIPSQRTRSFSTDREKLPAREMSVGTQESSLSGSVHSIGEVVPTRARHSLTSGTWEDVFEDTRLSEPLLENSSAETADTAIAAIDDSLKAYAIDDTKTIQDFDGQSDVVDMAESVTINEEDEQDWDRTLSYTMAPEDLQVAKNAPYGTTESFWNYEMYKNPEGRKPSVHYCKTFAQAEQQCALLMRESRRGSVLGFDLEWTFGSTAGKGSIKRQISLIQLASEKRCMLFHVARFDGDSIEKLMPPSLKTILESESIVKAGVNVAGDAKRLSLGMKVQMRGLQELSHLYKIVKYGDSAPSQVNKRLVALAYQVEKMTGLPMRKDEVRTSDWMQPLKSEQIKYACTDAYAGFQLFHILNARRKEMMNPPPMPAFYEQDKPLMLGNGKPPPRKTQLSPPPVIQNATNNEESQDCEELDDLADNSGLMAGQEEEGEEEEQEQERKQRPSKKVRHSRPDLADEGETAAAANGCASPRPAPSPNDSEAHSTSALSRPGPTSPEIQAADEWIENVRAADQSGGQTTVRRSVLRAYHVWHEGGHDIEKTAALLRQPPLAATTVSSYILEAIRQEDLPFRPERIKDVLRRLPHPVQQRNRYMIDRIIAQLASTVPRES